MQLEIEGRTNDQVQTKEGPVKAQVATQLSEISDIAHVFTISTPLSPLRSLQSAQPLVKFQAH